MKKKLRILILEDLPADAELMKDELLSAKIDFTSKWVETKEDFLKELDSFKPDLILSDYSLPSFTGLEALKIVRKRFPFLPFIIVTGSINEETAVLCMRTGADDYVLKGNLIRIGPAVTAVLEKTLLKAEKERMEKKIRVSLKEKEVLLKEIHHRVKNNMQIVISLMRLQSRKITDKKMTEIFNICQNRIRSMAFVHERLYHSDDFAHIRFNDYIEQMVVHIFQTYTVDSKIIGLELDLKDIVLNVIKAIPCGLIINELVSNAIKHAFPKGRKGEICLKFLEKKKDEATLVISDNGIGFPDDIDFRNTETLGLQIVCDLVQQIDGKIELDKKHGTSFTVTFKR
jgi:two-component sensor histidine kinase